MPQNGMMGGMPSTTMGDMGPTSSLGMGPSGMAGQGYFNTGMGGFQGGFNMGPTSPPSPLAFSMYGWLSRRLQYGTNFASVPVHLLHVWVAFKAALIWDQLRLRPPSPSSIWDQLRLR